MPVCEYCNNEFNDKSSLNKHQKTSKYCLKIRKDKEPDKEFEKESFQCEFCDKELTSKYRLENHLKICSVKKKQVEIKNKTIVTLQTELDKLKDEMVKLKEKSNEIDYSVYDEDTGYFDMSAVDIKIDKKEEQIDYSLYEDSEYFDMSSVDIKVEQIIQPLVINNYSLFYRKKDGYIDVTNLCKAGGKKYNHWNSLEKTQDFIKVVSMSVGIPTDLLIQNEDRRTWVHPQVAINIAQWISPEFDVQVLKWINNIKKESESTKDLTQIKEYKFGTSDLVVPIRADGMINATALCKAANKKLNDYTRLKTTQEYLKVLEINTGIPVLELLNLDVGGNHNGTWIHRKVGYHLAQWLSPGFAVQVSNILDELFITGKVEHGNQKTNEELESKYKEKITSLIEKLETNKQELETIKTNYQTLSLKNNSLMKRHHYVKFKESDPCFYIIDSGILCDCGQPNTQYKFGIAGTDQQHTIDNRLQSHRTLWPLLKVRFILFIKDVSVIEKTFKMMYEKEINPNGHEIIEGVLLENMIERLKKLFDLLCIKDYHIMSDEKIKEYNDYVDSTIKTKD